MKALALLPATLVLGLLTLSLQEVKDVKAPAKQDAKAEAVVKAQKPSYPLSTCVMSGEKLGANGDPVDHVVEGRLVRLCCKGCIKPVEGDAKSVFEKIDAAVVKAQMPGYPIEKCLVSGEPLGSMGEPINHVDGTRLVRLCCKGCVKGYKKDPAKHLATIDAALIKKQLKTYPIEKCLVSDEPLDAMGKPVDMLYGTTLVRLCCKGCKKGFLKNPAEYLAQIEKARKPAKRGH